MKVGSYDRQYYRDQGSFIAAAWNRFEWCVFDMVVVLRRKWQNRITED
jgi:hypothetical protein